MPFTNLITDSAQITDECADAYRLAACGLCLCALVVALCFLCIVVGKLTLVHYCDVCRFLFVRLSENKSLICDGYCCLPASFTSYFPKNMCILDSRRCVAATALAAHSPPLLTTRHTTSSMRSGSSSSYESSHQHTHLGWRGIFGLFSSLVHGAPCVVGVCVVECVDFCVFGAPSRSFLAAALCSVRG